MHGPSVLRKRKTWPRGNILKNKNITGPVVDESPSMHISSSRKIPKIKTFENLRWKNKEMETPLWKKRCQAKIAHGT